MSPRDDISERDDDRCMECLAGVVNLHQWEWWLRPVWVKCFTCDGTRSKREGARRKLLGIVA